MNKKKPGSLPPSRGRADAHVHRTAIVHTLTVDVSFDQISLFAAELQRRRVMTRQGSLLKRTSKKKKKKRNLANEGGFVRTFEPM